MGIFSGKIQTFVSLAVVPMGGDTEDNPLLRNLIAAQVTNTRPAEAVRNSILNSMAIQGNNFFNYAKSGKYIHALPTGNLSSNKVDRALIQSVFTSRFPDVLPRLIDAYLDYPPALYWAKVTLQANGYNFTDKLVNLTITVYQDDWNSYQLTANFGIERAEYDEASGTTSVTLSHTYENESVIEVTDYYPYTVQSIPNSDADYYFGTFFNTTGAGTDPDIHYGFMYEKGSGLYPELDGEAIYNSDSSYYPIVPIRQDFKFINENKTTQEYLTSKQILRKVNFNIDDIIGQVSGDGEDTKPDLDNIQEISIAFMAPVTSEYQSVLEYTTRYFYDLYLSANTNKYTKADWEKDIVYGSWEDLATHPFPAINSVIIEEQSFNCKIEYNYIEKYVYPTPVKLGPIGSWHTLVDRKPNITITRNGDGDEDVDKVYNTCSLYYGLQTDTEELTYIEIHGLVITSAINTTHNGVQYTRDEFVLGDTTRDVNLAVPINNRIIRDLTTLEQHKVLVASVSLVVYGATVVYTKWYQTGLFTFIVLVVMLVIAVFTGYIDGVVKVLTSVNTGLATGFIGYQTALYILGKGIVSSVLLSYALKFSVKEFGLEGTLIGIAVLSAVSYFYGGIPGLDFAISVEGLLKITSTIVQTITIDLNLQAMALQDEYDEFYATKQQQQDNLNALQDAGGDDVLKTALISSYYIGMFMDETPEQFYNRTLNQNPADTIYEIHDNYVNYMLRLPENDMTLPWSPQGTVK